jgi:hypothetical protein
MVLNGLSERQQRVRGRAGGPKSEHRRSRPDRYTMHRCIHPNLYRYDLTLTLTAILRPSVS